MEKTPATPSPGNLGVCRLRRPGDNSPADKWAGRAAGWRLALRNDTRNFEPIFVCA